MTDKPISAIKAFEADMTCRGFQFEQGKTYTHEGKVKACEGGFHVITGHPLEVFKYYTPAGSRFFRVEISGSTHSDDGEKTAAEILTIGEEIGHAELIDDAVKYVLAKARPTGAAINSADIGVASNSADRGVASNSADSGVASNSGYRGAAINSADSGVASNSGYRGAAINSGDIGAASNSADRGAAINSADSGVASNSGDSGAAINSGDIGVASNSADSGVASNSGYRGAASNSGDIGVAINSADSGVASNSGYRGAAINSGDIGAASNSGFGGGAADFSGTGRVMGIDGSALFSLERDDSGIIVSTASGIVGQDGIEAGTWYHCQSGKLVAV